MTGFLFLFVGKTKEGFIKAGLEKYLGYIKKYVQAEVREIKGAGGSDRVSDTGAVMEKEAELVLARLEPSDNVVLLDEHGGMADSKGFSRDIKRFATSGKRTVFVCGGPYGNSGRLRERADKAVSLSKLTFTHEIARLVLMEQVYRAFTIIMGKKYHY